MDNTEDFLKNYRGRYSQYWVERWGLIPELPTSFDNANSMYELVAWLQRAFTNLLDDFQQLEGEFEDFKNAIIDLLEYLIPELIRRYSDSAEFRSLFIILLEDILAGEERTWVKDLLKELIEIDMREWIEDYLRDLLNDLESEEVKYITPERFGAVGDGIADDWLACQKAIDTACQSDVGAVVIFKPNKKYRLHGKTLIVWGSNVTLIGYGTELYRTGDAGYHGDVLSVTGKNSGMYYWGNFGEGDYNVRTLYTGSDVRSTKVLIEGFKKFSFSASLDGKATNGISGINCDLKVRDCVVENAPQTSFAFPVQGSKQANIHLEGCSSIGARGHAYRVIAYEVTSNTNVNAVLKNCSARGTKGTNTFLSDDFYGNIVDLYLRGASIGSRFNIVTENCDFESGVYHPASGGFVTQKNLKCGFYYRGRGSGEMGENIENIVLTSSFTIPSLSITCSMLYYVFDGGVRINGLKHPYSSDDTVCSFAGYSIKKLVASNLQKGKILLGVDSQSVQDITISNSHIYSTGKTIISAGAGSKIVLDNCILEFEEYLLGIPAVTYVVKNNKILRKRNTSGYYTIRDVEIGSFTNNEMIITAPATNTEQVAIPKNKVYVMGNKITQLDGTVITDYGGTSVGKPTTGYRFKGQFTYEATPSAGGYLGYVCTASGVDGGTQKGFGLIEV